MLTSDSSITTSLYFGRGEKQLLLWLGSVRVSIQGYENFPNPGVFLKGTVGHLYGARQNYLFYCCIPQQFFQIVTCVSFESEQWRVHIGKCVSVQVMPYS